MGLSVGNEVYMGIDDVLKANLVPVMHIIHMTLVNLGLDTAIKILIAHSISVLSNSYPPSADAFDPTILEDLLAYSPSPPLPFSYSTLLPLLTSLQTIASILPLLTSPQPTASSLHPNASLAAPRIPRNPLPPSSLHSPPRSSLPPHNTLLPLTVAHLPACSISHNSFSQRLTYVHTRDPYLRLPSLPPLPLSPIPANSLLLILASHSLTSATLSTFPSPLSLSSLDSLPQPPPHSPPIAPAVPPPFCIVRHTLPPTKSPSPHAYSTCLNPSHLTSSSLRPL